MKAVKNAVMAVWNNRFAGKVALYPQLHELPLTAMADLDTLGGGLADYVRENGWCRQAERMLYRMFGKEE